MKLISLLCSLMLSVSLVAQSDLYKKEVIKAVDDRKDHLITMSDKIWSLAEVAFEEVESSRILSDYAKSEGFTVERGVADIPTAFVATYGSGHPVIGILGEFDALPGVSQKAIPSKEYKAILPDGPAPIPVHIMGSK